MIKPLPRLNVDDFANPQYFIMEFYLALGWDLKTQELDPRKILIHPDTWGEICNEFRNRWGISAALTWMNCGPSGDTSNPYNLDKEQVKLEEGAMVNLPTSAVG
ncbi:MAG TPA: hypothetical protein GXX63_12380 [Tissierellia bacterium]|nr:hypothetical protein [Tissierellia bacterium]